MYDNHKRDTNSAYRDHRYSWLPAFCTCLMAAASVAYCSTGVQAQDLDSASVIRKISGTSEKLELTTNSSRILTLEKNIPRVQVNNPDLLAVTPLSATQVQISAKKAGVTQVNLWDSEGKVHCVDVMIYGDARELEVALQTQFPHASIKVFRYSESLVLTGFVDRPDHVSPIMQLAADYSPKIINNIQVGGVQQVLLKVKIMEVSRTKLRELGADWAVLNGSSILAASNVSGLLQNGSSIISGGGDLAKVGGPVGSGGQTFQFGVFKGNSAFLGFLDALQSCQAAKILAEPNIVAISGRPAQFQAGGEFPVPVPQSLGTTTIEFKPFGTIVDFLPIVLGNGNIRLEVRPQISQADYSKAVSIQGTPVPALSTRKVDTAVEMKAGQTFAIGGLIQELAVTRKGGLPYVSDLPILGVPFRKTSDTTEETELLIFVTPEFVDPMDACEVPCSGPGMNSTSPNTRGLFCGGYMEVPTACNPTQGLGSCGQDPCGRCNSGGCNAGCQSSGVHITNGDMPVQKMPEQNMMPTPAGQIPGGTGYDDSPNSSTVLPTPESDQDANTAAPAEKKSTTPVPQDLTLPEGSQKPASDNKSAAETKPAVQPSSRPSPSQPVAPEAPLPKPAQAPPVTPVPGPAPNSGSYYPSMQPSDASSLPVNGPTQNSAYNTSRPYTLQRHPVFMRNASRPNNPQTQQWQPAAPARENNLIGPVGYDVQQ